MNLERFFLYSIIVHIIIFAAIMMAIPAEEKKNKGREFFTQLVSPQEPQPQRQKPAPRLKPHYSPRTPPGSSGAPASEPKSTRRIPDMKRIPREEPGQSPGDLQMSGGTQPPLPSKNTGRSGEGKTDPGSRETIPDAPGRQPSLREKLFDQNIIGDLAKKGFEKGEKEKKEKVFTFDGKEYKFLLYNQRLKERIENIWLYPPDAAAKGIYGDLIIRFTIKKNGKLGAVELVRTSGHKTLDDAAIKALRDAAPYWPLPEEWGMEAYTIEGHFVYSLYGYYVL